MKILIYFFLIYINFCTSNFIHHGSKLPVTHYPKKVQPGMLQYLKGTIFKQDPTRGPGIEYTAWPTMADPVPNVEETRRFFPPFEKTYVDETNKRRVKKVLQAYSVFGPKRAKRAVDPKQNDEHVQTAQKQGLTSTGSLPKLTKSNPEKPKSLKTQPSPNIAKTGNGTRRRGVLRSGSIKKKGKRGNLRQRKRVGKPRFPRRARPRLMNAKKRIARKRKNVPVKKTKRSKLEKRFKRQRSANEGYNQMKVKARKGPTQTGLQAKKKDTRRLIAARDATIEEYPYVVSIQKGKEHWCAGAILNPRLVISTANCFWKGHHSTRLHVHAGSRFTDRGGQTAKIQEIMKHPLWRLRSGPDYDLAMMVLDRNLNIDMEHVVVHCAATEDTRLKTGLKCLIEASNPSTPTEKLKRTCQSPKVLLRYFKAGLVRFSHTLHAVDLPNRDMMPPFEDVWVTGWGSTRRDGVYDSTSSTLQVYHAQVMNRNKCNNVTKRFGVAVSENFICLTQMGRRAPCTRDTGAPAVSDGVLWGLASWGIRKLCGTDRYPAMFSYIASDYNMDFIANATTYLMADERYYPMLDAGPREIGHALIPAL